MKKELEMFTVDVSTTLKDAMGKINSNKLRGVVVLDGNKVVGMITDGDVRRAYLRNILPIISVEKIMNVNCFVSRDRDKDALKKMANEKMVTLLPVVDKNNNLLDIYHAYEPFQD